MKNRTPRSGQAPPTVVLWMKGSPRQRHYRRPVTTTYASQRTVQANNRNRIRNICRAVMLLENARPLPKIGMAKWPVFSSGPVRVGQYAQPFAARN